MSKRRRRLQTSSLDLFLDTICNAFGGIMFISILISILIQMRGNPSDTPASKDGVTESEALDKQEKVERLQQQIRVLTETVSDRERLLFNEESAESNALLARKEKLVEDLEKAQLAEQSLLGTTASKGIAIQKAQQDLQELEKRLKDARLAVSERSKELEESLDAVETTTTLPKVSNTLKGNLMFAMRYGKLFLITDTEGDGDHGVNSKHASALDLGIGVQIRLKQAAGWDLDSAQDFSEFKRVLDNHLNSSTFISVAVFSDSHSKFTQLKAKLIEMQYDYDLLPLDNPDTLMIVKGGTATVQ
jgi:hypothetical protein